MRYMIQLHNGRYWGDVVRNGYTTRDEAETRMARLQEEFIFPHSAWRVVEVQVSVCRD